MSATNILDALSEFKTVVNSHVSIQDELQRWGNKLIQFIVKGGKDCYMTIQNGRVSIAEGTAENPSLTFTALDGHLVDLITGQTDYTSLDIMGSITFQGDEHDKNTFIAVLGLFIDVLLGEFEDFDEE